MKRVLLSLTVDDHVGGTGSGAMSLAGGARDTEFSPDIHAEAQSPNGGIYPNNERYEIRRKFLRVEVERKAKAPEFINE